MKKVFGLAILWLLLCLGGMAHAGTGCLQWGTCSTTTQVSVSLTGGNICIWIDFTTWNTLDLGTHTVSDGAQVVTWSYAPRTYWYVDDQKGIDAGYYTTVQMSGHLFGDNGSLISGENLYMKTSLSTILLWGRLNARVVIDDGMADYQSLDAPRQLIERNTAANFGVIGKYWSLPLLQLVIPAYQPVGAYLATVVFTLYEN